MRVRKRRGSKPGAVTLTQDEVMTACLKYVEGQGYETGSQMWMKINLPKEDSIGRKREGKVEVIIETDE